MPIIRQSKSAAGLKLWYRHCSARTALSILIEDYGMRARTFMWSTKLYTVERALTNIPYYLIDMPCGQFGVIRFFGGPPGHAKWYEGTLLTMLCDTVLFKTHARF